MVLVENTVEDNDKKNRISGEVKRAQNDPVLKA